MNMILTAKTINEAVTMSRRRFIQSAVALTAAPAIIRASSLMSIKPLAWEFSGSDTVAYNPCFNYARSSKFRYGFAEVGVRRGVEVIRYQFENVGVLTPETTQQLERAVVMLAKQGMKPQYFRGEVEPIDLGKGDFDINQQRYKGIV